MKTEECIIDGQRIKLPQALCENTELFQALLSVDSWNAFTEQQRRHLMVINDILENLTLPFPVISVSSLSYCTLSIEFHRLKIEREWDER